MNSIPNRKIFRLLSTISKEMLSIPITGSQALMSIILLCSPDSAAWHAADAQPASFDMNFPFAADLTLASPEPVVPGPSTILGALVSAGLILAVLVRRFIQKRTSATAI
jgi:hypothetical protein